jgi:hypothetical protein
MSALPPIADIRWRQPNGRFVPQADTRGADLAAALMIERLDRLSLEVRGLRYIKAAVGQFRYRCRPSEAV